MNQDAELEDKVLKAAEKEFDFVNRCVKSIDAIYDYDGDKVPVWRVVLSFRASDDDLAEITEGETEAQAEEKRRFFEDGFEVTAIFDGNSLSEKKWRGIDYF